MPGGLGDFSNCIVLSSTKLELKFVRDTKNVIEARLTNGILIKTVVFYVRQRTAKDIYVNRINKNGIHLCLISPLELNYVFYRDR